MSKTIEQFQVHINAKEHLGEPNDNFYGFRKSQIYINNSSLNIYVTHRNNLVVNTPRQLDSNFPKGDIVIRTIYDFTTTSTIKDVLKCVQDITSQHTLKSTDLKIIEDRLLRSLSRSPFAAKETIVLDRVIPVKAIVEKSMIYLHDDDLLLSTKETACQVLHPFSSEAGLDPETVDYVTNHGLTGFFIELIDNENQSSTRYMFTGRRLLEVNPKRDPNRKSGVYYHHTTHHPLTGSDIKQGFCTLEESLEDVGLYKTRDEAMTGGDPDIISKKELEESKKEVIRAQQELERVKHEASLEKERNEKIRLEREEFYAERKLKRVDTYEERSTVRKDSSEVLKLAAAAVGGAIAVFGIMRVRS